MGASNPRNNITFSFDIPEYMNVRCGEVNCEVTIAFHLSLEQAAFLQSRLLDRHYRVYRRTYDDGRQLWYFESKYHYTYGGGFREMINRSSEVKSVMVLCMAMARKGTDFTLRERAGSSLFSDILGGESVAQTIPTKS